MGICKCGHSESDHGERQTIEQKLEDWAHDLAHSRVFNGAAPVCREAAALIADLRQTCADQGAAYHALAERLAERSNRDFVACTAAGAEGVRTGVALAEATSGSCTCGRLQLVPEQHKPECPVYRPAQTAPPEQWARVGLIPWGYERDAIRRAAELVSFDLAPKVVQALNGYLSRTESIAALEPASPTPTEQGEGEAS